MARTVRDAKLDSRKARSDLKVSGKPYYRSIDTGLHLGYRKGQRGGVWVARWYRGNQEYTVEAIGATDDTIDADGVTIFNFSQAQAKARELFIARKREAIGGSAAAEPFTVNRCLGEYLSWMEENRKSALDARKRADALIRPALGGIECEKLTAKTLLDWLEKLAKSAALIRTRKGEAQRFRERPTDAEGKRRRRASANRTLTILKAALNRAWRAGDITNDAAWRRVEPFEEADAARVRYLTIVEAKRLINASDGGFRSLVRAALATGARYGELAALDVADFNPDSGTVHVRASKSGKGRHIVLAEEGLALFKGLAVGRPANAPLLPKSSGGRWLPANQGRPMATACGAGRIEPPANFHCLRHTYASHAIMNGAPLLVVAKNLGHADTRMVERHYGHLAPSYIADAIRAAAPKFGGADPSSIAAIGVSR